MESQRPRSKDDPFKYSQGRAQLVTLADGGIALRSPSSSSGICMFIEHDI